MSCIYNKVNNVDLRAFALLYCKDIEMITNKQECHLFI